MSCFKSMSVRDIRVITQEYKQGALVAQELYVELADGRRGSIKMDVGKSPKILGRMLAELCVLLTEQA